MRERPAQQLDFGGHKHRLNFPSKKEEKKEGETCIQNEAISTLILIQIHESFLYLLCQYFMFIFISNILLPVFTLFLLENSG